MTLGKNFEKKRERERLSTSCAAWCKLEWSDSFVFSFFWTWWVFVPISVLTIITTISTLLEDVHLEIHNFTPFFFFFACAGGNYHKISKKNTKSLFFHIQRGKLLVGRSHIDPGSKQSSRKRQAAWEDVCWVKDWDNF